MPNSNRSRRTGADIVGWAIRNCSTARGDTSVTNYGIEVPELAQLLQ
jgi:hypothetical protein